MTESVEREIDLGSPHRNGEATGQDSGADRLPIASFYNQVKIVPGGADH